MFQEMMPMSQGGGGVQYGTHESKSIAASGSYQITLDHEPLSCFVLYNNYYFKFAMKQEDGTYMGWYYPHTSGYENIFTINENVITVNNIHSSAITFDIYYM